jgi:ATP/maltotriose-dependent transcriptional regulator MalT
MGGVSACLRQLLRLPEAAAAARKTLEILRPYDRELADAKVFGRALAMLMADQGQAGEAQVMMQAAYDRLRDTDGKPHALRSSVTQTLANIALARGDAQTALTLAQRSRNELRTRTHSVQASVLTLIARAAIEAGDIKAAREAVTEARKIHAERGLPALSARALAQVAAELAALTGDRSGAEAEYAQLVQRFPADQAAQSAPFARLLVDNSRARVASSLGQWDEVARLLAPWLTPPAGATLPGSVRSETLLLAAEAAVNLRRPEATRLISDASHALEASDVPSSPRLARLRVLQTQLRASTS